MKYLFILNDSPYGIERTYNGLRLATSLSKQEGEMVSVFLMGDAAACSVSGQSIPNGGIKGGGFVPRGYSPLYIRRRKNRRYS